MDGLSKGIGDIRIRPVPRDKRMWVSFWLDPPMPHDVHCQNLCLRSSKTTPAMELDQSGQVVASAGTVRKDTSSSGKFTKLQWPEKIKETCIAIIIRNDPVWDDSNMTHLLASSCRDHPSTQQPGSPLRTPSCNGVCPWPSSASQHEAYEMEQLSNFQTLTCAVGSALSKSLGNTKGPILYSQSHASLVRVHAMWVFCSLYSPLRIPVPHDQCLRIISTLSNICPRF